MHLYLADCFWLQLHESTRRLTPLIMRLRQPSQQCVQTTARLNRRPTRAYHRNYSGTQNIVMTSDDSLDFNGRDVLSSRYDDVFGPIGDLRE